ncbi:response regulator [Pedobacter sp. MC2016-15]|uniref:hybrid sensor histidine kinase/response regulator transcription factor n=1 Tax=Pedobacter sp. MC2016-15 TaxID=2994473 RepID=UPI00224604B9|nr:two-component regulator propeller domain-containing protein [Pedobacter sp. MC2016-15]MCX2479849.1 response regulator [Pedobacter sp. MC2016-15]
MLMTDGTSFAQIKSKIQHLSTEDGLSHDGVTTVLKDRDGFMWFGTWDGINRFDGYNFVSYKTRPGDSSTLNSNRIDHMIEDHDGFLWLAAYDNQVYRFNKSNHTFLALSSLLEHRNIHDISFSNTMISDKRFVWLPTLRQGIFRVGNSRSGMPDIKRYAAGSKDEYEIPSNKINFLHTDQRQNIWIGTDRGLALWYFRKGRYKKINLPIRLASQTDFSCVAENRQMVWFGTADGRLISFDKEGQTFSEKKISDQRLNAMLLSKDQRHLYFSGSSELLTLSVPGLQLSRSPLPGAGEMLSIYEDRSGDLWIEPQQRGVIRYNPRDGKFSTYQQQNDSNFRNTSKEYRVMEDHTGKVWLSMKGGGFGYFDREKNTVAYFYNQPGAADRLFSNSITCSYFDHAGIMWLGTRDRGIEKIIFQNDDFKQGHMVRNSLNKSDNEIRGIYSDYQGRKWIASKSGKISLYDQNREIQDIFQNLPPGGLGIVYTILQDRKGQMWLGTKGNGLYRAVEIHGQRNKFRLSSYRNEPADKSSISSNLIYSILEDRKGRIWIGTYEHGMNLVLQDGEKISFANAANTFINYPKGSWDKIRHLAEDAGGKIWIATTHGLVIVSPPGPGNAEFNFRQFGKRPGDKTSLGNNDVQYICKDSKNRMWVATSGGGLNKVSAITEKGIKFKVFTKEDGLPSDYIVSIVEDNGGYLWLATENGLSRFDPEKSLFRNYDSYDGLPKTGFSEGSGIKLPNGNLMYGCMNGYLIFNPAAITDQKREANMAFTNLQVNNKSLNGASMKTDINESRKVLLSHDQNMISIAFAVLDYRAGNNQSYAYRLQGLEKEWHQVKNQRNATYTNLPPGDYIFQVKSMHSNLYMSIPAKSVAFTIASPPWRSGWAYALYVILLLILLETVRRIVYTMIRLRHRVAVEQQLTELKLSFFTNISHELRTPLTLIVNPIEELYQRENLTPRGLEYIDVLRRNTNRMVRFINQLLDFRKAQSGKMSLKVQHTEMLAFLRDIAACYAEVSKEKNITLSIVSNVDTLFAWIDPGKIDIVVYNILSNAFKFSPADSSIRLDLLHEDDFFTISITDEGPGVPADQLKDIFELYYELDKLPGNTLEGTGIGLALCKEIVGLHDGSIEAQNAAGGGLRIVLKLKTGKDHFDAAALLAGNTEPILLRTPVHHDPGYSKPAPDQQEGLPLVLLVEDNPELRRFLAGQLEDYYRVMEAKDGREGLDMAMKFNPDLVLSDVMMPRMDGIQLLDQLKNDILSSHIPVILLTAKSSVEHQIEGLRYGADYYITKPFHIEFIVVAIDNLLKQRKQIFESFLAHKRTIELSPSEIMITSKDEIFLKEIIRIVEQGMTDPDFSIDEVAESVAMGRTTFYKKFKSLTNLAPVEFVRDMRLKRARQLFEAGENNVSEVAYAVGFNSASYFSTCFKEAYGVSPSVFAKTGLAKTV